MFRKMRRFKQQLTPEEYIKILMQEPRGILSLIGDNGYPYGIPMTHYYDKTNGHIYFHCAKTGHKIDALKQCNKVSFCVMNKGEKKGDGWALDFQSVVVFGTIRFIEEKQQIFDICTKLCSKFTDDPAYPVTEFKKAENQVLCLELIPEHITGKNVNES